MLLLKRAILCSASRPPRRDVVPTRPIAPSVSCWTIGTRRRDRVLATHDAEEEREDAYLLASRALRAHRQEGRPADRRLDRVRLERSREFGGPWLGHTLWRVLKFDELLESVLPQGREDIPWAEMASILAIARL